MTEFYTGPRTNDGEGVNNPTHTIAPGEMQVVARFGVTTTIYVLSGHGEASIADSNIVELHPGSVVGGIYTTCEVTNTGNEDLEVVVSLREDD